MIQIELKWITICSFFVGVMIGERGSYRRLASGPEQLKYQRFQTILTIPK
jgi:hypothetical protein